MSTRIAKLACVLAAALALASRDARAEPTPTELDEAVAQHRAFTTSATARERELAQYRLAVALHHLELHHAAYAIFSEIADHPNHLELEATLPWLAKLASELPEPADVDERIGKYDERTIGRLESQSKPLYWQLSYLLGRYKYRNHQFEDALRLFARVDRASRYHCKAQFLAGLANVHLRRPIAAVDSFQHIVDAIDAGFFEGLEDKQRMRDLALLSIARTYYSASIRIDGRGAPAIHKVRLAAALEGWTAVDVASEYWMDALFEQSWAYFMVGEHARALGNLHMIASVSSATAHNPEVEILKSTVYMANCQFDDAATLTAQFHAKYQPIASELTKLISSFDGADQDERFYHFALDVRAGRAKLSPALAPVVTFAFGDRQFLRHLQYVAVLEDEQKRLAKTPAAFRSSPLGAEVADATQLARDIAIHNAAELARERQRRQLSELEEHLRDNVKLLVGAMAGQRGELDESRVPLRVPGYDAERNVVRPDEEHVIWPFTGEFWSDEAGSYRQSIRSKCR